MAITTVLTNGGLGVLTSALTGAGLGTVYLSLETGYGAALTTLSAASLAGATTFTVASAASLSVGQNLWLDDTGANPEGTTITAISGTTITVAALTYAHASGANVKAGAAVTDTAGNSEDATTGRTAAAASRFTTVVANDSIKLVVTPTTTVSNEKVTGILAWTAASGGTLIAHATGYQQPFGTSSGTSSATFEIDIIL